MFRGMPFGCLAIYAARTTATRAVAQLMEAVEIRVEAGKQVEEAEVDGGCVKAAEELGLREGGRARQQLRVMVEAVMRAQSEKGAGPPSPRPARPASAQARPPAQGWRTPPRVAPKQLAPAAAGGPTPPRQAPAWTEPRRAVGGGEQHGEGMEALEARRLRFEREAERPMPPLPLFGEGPQGARRTQAGGQSEEGAGTGGENQRSSYRHGGARDTERRGARKRSSLRGRTKVAKAGPLRARVKSAKVRPTPYVYFPRVAGGDDGGGEARSGSGGDDGGGASGGSVASAGGGDAGDGSDGGGSGGRRPRRQRGGKNKNESKDARRERAAKGR